MSNLETPVRSEPASLPLPTPGLRADAAMLPPPDLRVPALAPPSLPSLTGAPVVPPMPRFSLDEADAELTRIALDESADAELRVDRDECPVIAEATPAGSVPGLAAAWSAPPVVSVDDAGSDDGMLPPHLAETEAAPTAPDAFVTSQLPSIAPVPAIPSPTLAPSDGAPSAGSAMLSAANEPLGAPPQVAMVMPSLPTLAAAAPSPTPAAPPSHHPSQVGAAPMTSLADAMANATSASRVPSSQGGAGRAVARTLFAVVLAGVVGVGAHVGHDWWQQRDATSVGGVNVDGTDLASWPEVEPPAIRYTDSVTVFETPDGTRSLTAHREIASGLTQAKVVATDAAGAVVSDVEVDIRGEQSFVRPTPDATWSLAPQADAEALLGDAWTTDVFTVRDLVPAEALPYTVVLEAVERSVPVEPLRPAAVPGEPAETPIAISTDPTSMVWQYRFIIDVDSFRANETLVFQEWQRRLGRSAVPRMEAWIDATGIVRQLSIDVEGTKVTHTLVGGTATSNRFDGNPLLDGAPQPPADGAAEVTSSTQSGVEAGE